MSSVAENYDSSSFPLPGRGDHGLENPTNEFGIVIPPPISECIRELCRCKDRDEEACTLNIHHLHSTYDAYFEEGRIPHKFRDLSALTVWMPECRHMIYHEVHAIDVPIPGKDVMRQCIREARSLRRLASAHKELGSVDKELAQKDVSRKRAYSLESRMEELYEDKDELIQRVMAIEVIPDQLVTGAVLICAPDYAQRRLLAGTGYVLTGILKREEIPEAVSIANEILEFD